MEEEAKEDEYGFMPDDELDMEDVATIMLSEAADKGNFIALIKLQLAYDESVKLVNLKDGIEPISFWTAWEHINHEEHAIQARELIVNMCALSIGSQLIDSVPEHVRIEDHETLKNE